MRAVLAALTGLALTGAPARAADTAPAPQEGLGAPPLTDTTCADQTYPDCRRIRYAFGPVTVHPGANQQLLAQSISKPLYDGYVTRITANLYNTDGTIPPIDVVHLHHAAWLSSPSYGNFAVFFANGEEKTRFELPSGYGMHVAGSDTWSLAYMLHNLTPNSQHVYVTYDLDYVPAEPAEAAGIKPAIPLWLDVQSQRRPFYPVFNVQRGYGQYDPRFKRRVCVFPAERCAAFDPYGENQPAYGPGYDYTVPQEYAGTIVSMGGHLHPGGLEDQVSVVRGDQVKRVFNSDADYFDPAGPVSWDMAMTVTRPDWRVAVRPGDKLRLNAVYDSQAASWYEDMGIVMAWIAPGDTTGVDPFAPGANVQTEGVITHGHLPEADHHGGTGFRRLSRKIGRIVSQINISHFIYKPGDLSTSTGIPRVRANRRLLFYNGDSDQSIWHTITTCRAPCTGETGISYPVANSMPLDSLELGSSFLPGLEPASGHSAFSFIPKRLGLRPGQTYTYFCRIHPFMRGAFKVVK